MSKTTIHSLIYSDEFLLGCFYERIYNIVSPHRNKSSFKQIEIFHSYFAPIKAKEKIITEFLNKTFPKLHFSVSYSYKSPDSEDIEKIRVLIISKRLLLKDIKNYDVY